MAPKLRGIGLTGRGLGNGAKVVVQAMTSTVPVEQDPDYVEAKVGENGRVFFENGQGQEKLDEINRRGDEDIFQNSASPTCPEGKPSFSAPNQTPQTHTDPENEPCIYHSAFSPKQVPDSAFVSSPPSGEDFQVGTPVSPPRVIPNQNTSNLSFEALTTPTTKEAISADKPVQTPTTPPPKKTRISYEQLKITMKIGRGRFGDVYRVTNRNDKNEVYALKKVSYCSSSEEVKNITWSKRPKKHLLTSHTAYWSRSRNEVCILMEYMPYGSLQDYVENLKKQGRSVSKQDQYILAVSMLDGLHILEKRHMIHRDIKPANILIGANGIVKIGDFGVSRITEKNDNSQAYTQVGSEIWLAPERLEGRPYSYPSDVYSFGLVLAYCALGVCPVDQFTENRQVDLYQKIENPEDPSERVAAARDIVWECTQLNPVSRPNAKALSKRYEAIEEYKAILKTEYGVDVSHLSPFHNDDYETLLQPVENDLGSGLEGGDTGSFAEGDP